MRTAAALRWVVAAVGDRQGSGGVVPASVDVASANHAIRRPLRLWSLDGGPDAAAPDALARGGAYGPRLPEPSPADLREQLAASRTHLRTVEASYWERGWRSANPGLGIYPEYHLWNAVHGYLAARCDERGAT